MKSVAFPCTYWTCPGCGAAVWLRDVVLHFDELQYIGPEEEFGCAGCGHCLSQKQIRPTRLNGLTKKGWWLVCPSTYHDIHLATEDLPAVVKCERCGEEHELKPPA